jgi:uncharacterized protein (DUF302 family)
MPTTTAPDDGLVTTPSAHSVAETVRRLEEALHEKGVHVFARIDHAEGAARAGLALRPTQVLLFGNPQFGTPLMQSNQAVGIDLPLKALVWEDEAGMAWLSYYTPESVAERHHIRDQEATVKAMRTALEALARRATAP